MIISKEKPVVYERCKEVFGVEWEKGIIITYGESIHCINDLSNRPDLIVHEQTHIDQQTKYGVEAWWDRYFIDKEFRLDQEVEAYRNQVKYMKENYPRPYRRALIKSLCRDMSTLYKGMCTESEAMELISI